jgi:ATP-dependent Lon protease
MSQTKTQYPTSLPVLALKGVVVLPYMPIALGVGRPKSVRALERSLESDRLLALDCQRD